jgi:hypothetical protein
LNSDALPSNVLWRHIAAQIETRMDLNALRRVLECEHAKPRQLCSALAAVGSTPSGAAR